MFERYTESARRVLFFARYETSQSGGTSIEPEHILVGAELTDGHPQAVEKTTLIRNDARTRVASRIGEIRLTLTMLDSLQSPSQQQVSGAVQQLLGQVDELERDLDL